MITSNCGRYAVHRFDSLTDLLENADVSKASTANAKTDVARMLRGREAATSGEGWTYGEHKNAAEYQRVMREGWHDAVKRVDAITASIVGAMATPLNVKRKMRRGDQGDEFDIHAARAGNFSRAWSSRRRQLARAPAPIRIVVGVVYNCGADADAFFWRGACALAVARGLRTAGYRVSISGMGLLVGPYTSHRGDYLARFDALGFGEALDTGRLAAILCSPAMLRHVLFRTALLLPNVISRGYGHAPSDGQVTRACVDSGVFPNIAREEMLVIPDVNRESAARQWLAEVSARFA